MAFTFLPNIPSAPDLLSSSQSQIQENFQFLGDTTGNAVSGFYKLPNGLIFQWGNQGPGGAWTTQAGDNISPAQSLSFTTSVYAIYLTPRINDATSKRFVVDGNVPPTNSQFFIRTSTLSFSTIYWLAIGV